MQNSLAEHFPFLVKEWDMEKNFPLDPSELSSGSHRKVWWRCGKGHTWLAEVKSRTGGSGCPFCANRSIAARGKRPRDNSSGARCAVVRDSQTPANALRRGSGFAQAGLVAL